MKTAADIRSSSRFQIEDTKSQHVGQYVSGSRPTIESAILVLEDVLFRRALAAAVKSFLAGPAPPRPSKPIPVVRPQAKPDDIRIILRRLDGATAIVYVQPNEPIDDIRKLVSEQSGISVPQLRFVYKGSPLSYGRTFAQENIGADAIIHVILQITGS